MSEYCLACPKKPECKSICADLEAHLKATCDTSKKSLRLVPFAMLNAVIRKAIGAEVFGNPNAWIYPGEEWAKDDD